MMNRFLFTPLTSFDYASFLHQKQTFSTCLGEFLCCVPHACHAVRSNARNEILFDEEGNYAGFDRNAPTSASGGKPKVLKLMKLG